nr:MAG TPA: hypothetical protein [Caudoviricetes sp.]
MIYLYSQRLLYRPPNRHIHSLHRRSCGDSTRGQIFRYMGFWK